MAPVALALVPAAGAWWARGEQAHAAALAFLSLLAVASTWWSARRHHRFYAWFALLPGLGMLWAGELGAWFLGEALATLATVAGGTLIVGSHLLNLRLAHGHVHDSRCGHG